MTMVLPFRQKAIVKSASNNLDSGWTSTNVKIQAKTKVPRTILIQVCGWFSKINPPQKIQIFQKFTCLLVNINTSDMLFN